MSKRTALFTTRTHSQLCCHWAAATSLPLQPRGARLKWRHRGASQPPGMPCAATRCIGCCGVLHSRHACTLSGAVRRERKRCSCNRKRFSLSAPPREPGRVCGLARSTNVVHTPHTPHHSRTSCRTRCNCRIMILRTSPACREERNQPGTPAPIALGFTHMIPQECSGSFHRGPADDAELAKTPAHHLQKVSRGLI